MKRIFRLSAGILAAALLLAGCVPEKNTMITADPDFVPGSNVKIDFVQLQNDTFDGISSIEEGQPFVFISDVDISGSTEDKQISVEALASDGASEYDCKSFAAAMLAQINDAAATQDPNFQASTTQSFGTLYDTYSVSFRIRNQADGSEMFTMNVPAGGEIPLDPNYDKYVQEWIEGYNVFMENAVYDINGHMILDD